MHLIYFVTTLLGLVGFLSSCQPGATSLQQNSTVDQPDDPNASELGVAAPTFSSIASVTYFVGNSLSLDINDSSTGNDTDADGDSITYSCYVDYLIDGLVANILKCSDIGMSFNPLSGALNWGDFTVGCVGTYELKIVGTDGVHEGSVVFNFNVIGVPSISYAGSFLGTVGSSLNIVPTTLAANGSGLTSCYATPSLPLGISINGTTCVITGTPTVASAATDYTIKAVNAAGTSAGVIVSIAINAVSAEPIVTLLDNKITVNLGSVESALYPTIIVDAGTRAWSINGLWEDYSSYREAGDYINKNDSDPVWRESSYDGLWSSDRTHWVEVGEELSLFGVDRKYILKDTAHIGKPYNYGLSSALPETPASSAMITFKQKFRYSPGNYIGSTYSSIIGEFQTGDRYYGEMEDVIISGGTNLPAMAKVIWVDSTQIHLLMDVEYNSSMSVSGATITGLVSGAIATLLERSGYGSTKFIRVWDDSNIGDGWRYSWTQDQSYICATSSHPSAIISGVDTLPPAGEWIQFMTLHDLNKSRLYSIAFSLESDWYKVFTDRELAEYSTTAYYAPTISLLGSDGNNASGRLIEMADVSLTQNYLLLLTDNKNLLDATKVVPLPIIDQSNGKIIAEARNLASAGEYIHVYHRSELLGIYQIGGEEYRPLAPYNGLQESKSSGKVLLKMNPAGAWKITVDMKLSSSASSDPIIGGASDTAYIARYSTQNRLRYRNGSTYCYYNVPAIWDNGRHALVFNSNDGYTMSVSIDGGAEITSTCSAPSAYPIFTGFAEGQSSIHSRSNIYYSFTYESTDGNYTFDFINTLMRNTSLIDQNGVERGMLWQSPEDASSQL